MLELAFGQSFCPRRVDLCRRRRYQRKGYRLPKLAAAATRGACTLYRSGKRIHNLSYRRLRQVRGLFNCISTTFIICYMSRSCFYHVLRSTSRLSILFDTDCDLGYPLLWRYQRATKLGKTMAPVLQPPFLSGGLWVDISCYEGRQQWWWL